ncbi:hypothetical protein [Fodinicola feengrottensis]|nr:hypothetical protein [Fodinicola feengrottensis]
MPAMMQNAYARNGSQPNRYQTFWVGLGIMPRTYDLRGPAAGTSPSE